MLDVVGVGDGSLLVHIIQAPIPFIHISGLLYILYIYIYIYNVSAPSTVANGHKDANTP
jgi:hypothetical protein